MDNAEKEKEKEKRKKKKEKRKKKKLSLSYRFNTVPWFFDVKFPIGFKRTVLASVGFNGVGDAHLQTQKRRSKKIENTQEPPTFQGWGVLLPSVVWFQSWIDCHFQKCAQKTSRDHEF